ncbi:15449_t:CDS:1, partial [Gigaspora margarita]
QRNPQQRKNTKYLKQIKQQNPTHRTMKPTTKEDSTKLTKQIQSIEQRNPPPKKTVRN